MEIYATIDRVEGDTAVLLIRPEEKEDIHWPIQKLPEDIFEGAILEIDIEIDHEQTEDAEKRVVDLIERLKTKTKNMDDG